MGVVGAVAAVVLAGAVATAAASAVSGPDAPAGRAPAEPAAGVAGGASAGTAVTPVGRMGWPVIPPPRVVAPFRAGPHPWSPGHRGIDLQAAPGTVVRAPAGGTVSFTGVVAGRPVLSIDHGGGLVSSVEPVVASVPLGARVRAGDAVGRLWPGPGHCRPSTCLHWGVRRAGVYLDPLTLVVRPPVILLPFDSTLSN